MNAARIAAPATPLPNATVTSTPKTAAAIAARCIAPRHVGGLSSRSARRWREICLASWRVCGRPVLPERSIVPAGVPRCLRVRLRLVCAIAPEPTRRRSAQHRERLFQDVALGGEAVQRHVVGEAVEGG